VVLDGARPSQVVDAILARHRLSAREEDVCRGMLRGLSDKEIAALLGVGLETVKANARAAFAKLSVSGRGGLVAKISG
jgi:DNA-binding CsgD family transcriptional regulator